MSPRSAGFGVALPELQSCFCLIFPCYTSILLFWNRNVYLCQCTLEVYYLYYFIEFKVKKLAELHKRLCIYILNSVGTVK